MKKSRVHTFTAFALSFVLSWAVATMVSCGGSSTPTSATTGTVNLSMTDPATCTFAFSNIWVTVTKVTASIDGSNWQTIVDLTDSPMQIDLLSLADSTSVCLLKSLGSSGPLPPGKYQQLRLYLLSNTASGPGTPSSNECKASSGWNCVVTGTDPNFVYSELQLPSEVQTGIKIPSSHIMSGGLTVTAGQSIDLNIDFQSCASIVHQGNGKYRLKPVLFAGEVSQNMNSISGQVVDSSTSDPIPNATVLFEQATSGVETVMDSTTTDSSGKFFVCPLPGASYNIVVTAQTSGSLAATYNPTVAFSVPIGTDLGQMPLVAETGGAATLEGQVDTTPNGESVTLIPTMSATPTGGSATDVIVPVFTVNGSTILASGQPPSVMTDTITTPTATNPACTVSGASCYNFMLTVPASNPNVGTYSSGAITYSGPASGDVTYSLTASAPACTTTATDTASPLVVTPDNTTTLSSSLSLTGCGT